MDKLEDRAVIKYFCKKGVSPEKIRYFIKTLGDESHSYSTVKKWAAEFRTWRESKEDYERSGALKRLLQTKTLSLCTV